MWFFKEDLIKKSEKVIKENPEIELSKVVFRGGAFVFYRETLYGTGIKEEFPDIRICPVKNEKGEEAWGVYYMRHTGKWEVLPIFGTFDHCLEEIKNRKYDALNTVRL